jgi:hypothetical protein
MIDNRYSLWFKDASDTVFMKNELGKPSVSDQLETVLSEAKIRWKKFKRVFKKK